MTTEVIRGKIEQPSENIRGFNSKAEYVKRVLALEAAAPAAEPRAINMEVYSS